MTKRFTAAMVAALLGFFSLGALPSAAQADSPYWQCVTFARMFSGINIFGDAWTWWKQAVGKYDVGFTPKAGAVLCFKPSGKMKLGHVAVVTQVLTDRVIQITHANWSRIGGTRGQIEKDVTVIDVSPAGDWSSVKVWYDPIRDLGSSTYPTHGFIYQDDNALRQASAPSNLNSAQMAALAVARGAATQVASIVRPGVGPLQMLGQAADSTDQIAALIQAATGRANTSDTN